jgi:hypothetical protein
LQKRKPLKTIIYAGIALGALAWPLASIAGAASNTQGLVALSLQGVGNGALADATCQGITCSTSNGCECLTATYTLVGNQGFAKGSLGVVLSIDTTQGGLPISDISSCNPATGTGTLKNVKGTTILTLAISGLECPTLGVADVFDGSYVITTGSGGKFSSATGGAGAINGSQVPVLGGVGQVAILGTLQATAPTTPPSPAGP